MGCAGRCRGLELFRSEGAVTARIVNDGYHAESISAFGGGFNRSDRSVSAEVLRQLSLVSYATPLFA